MEISVSEQLILFAGAGAAGLGLGFCCDMLEQIRRKSRFAGALADIAAALLFFCGAVFFALKLGRGELRPLFAAEMLAGAGAYFCFLRRAFRPVVRLVVTVLGAAAAICLLPAVITAKILKKIYKTGKNLFSYLHKWYKMISVPKGFSK